MKSNLLRYLVIPDCHHPYNDKRAWKLLLTVAATLGVYGIIILGDFGDFYAVSSHDKDPRRIRLLDDEVAEMHDRLKELHALKAKHKIYIQGNHEQRLERYLMTKAPELFNLVAFPDLMKLKERGWEYVPYRRYAQVGHMRYTHDLGKAGKGAIQNALTKFQTNITIGHTHRAMALYEANALGSPHVGISHGWLGDVAAVDYMHQMDVVTDWTLGFGLHYLDPKTNIVVATHIPIINYSCVIEGVLFSV